MQVAAVFVVPKFRKRVKSEPSGVTELVAPRVGIIRRLDGIPFHIGRLLPLHADVTKSEKIAPGMIENTVDHDLDAPLVRFFDQLEKQFVCRGPFPGGRICGFAAAADNLEITLRVGSEIRIDMVERVAVVFVLRAAVEDRIEFDRRDAEVLQVIKLVDDALQISAVAAVKDTILVKVLADGFLPFFADVVVARPWCDPPTVHIGKLEFERIAGRVVGRVAVVEALREDLIPDGGFSPFGHLGPFGLDGFLRHCGNGQQGQEQTEALHGYIC